MKHWYVIHTKPRKEAEAEKQLTAQGYQIWLPRITRERRVRGQWRPVTEPLFPRYLFLHADLENENTAPVRSTLGVSGFVRFGERPPPVADTIVKNLQSSAPNQDSHTDGPLFSYGDQIRVLEGPFENLTGIYQTEQGEARALILLRLLGRINRIGIERNLLEPA